MNLAYHRICHRYNQTFFQVIKVYHSLNLGAFGVWGHASIMSIIVILSKYIFMLGATTHL